MSAPGPVRAADVTRADWDGALLACTHCGESKPPTLAFFAPRPAKNNGLNSWCRECERARARVGQQRRRELMPEKVLEEKRRHARSEKGRAGKRANAAIENHKRRQRPDLPFIWGKALWSACREDWQSCCAYCSAPTAELWMDHFITLSDLDCPGTVPWNILPSCPPCNLNKSKRRPEVWLTDSRRLFAITHYLNQKAAIYRPDGMPTGTPHVRLWDWRK